MRRKDLFRCVVVGSVLLPAGAVPARAQAPTEGPAREAAQKPDTVRYELEGLVVTAHRVPLPEAKVASRVTVLTGEELRARGIHFVSEALRDVAGAAVVEGGSFGSLTSLFLRGGESDYVRVLVDGMPINEPGGAFDFADLTTDNVERIEVLRGPGSVLYGSDAMTGVVHIITRRGEGPMRARAGLRGGTFGTLVWNGAVAGGTERARYAFELSRFTSEGMLDFNNDYRNAVAGGRVQVVPDQRTEAAVTVRYTDSRFHFPTDGAGRLVDENQFQSRDGITAMLELDRFLTGRLAARLRLGLDDKTLEVDDAPDGPADTLGFFAFQSRQDTRRRSVDLRFDYRLGPATVLTLGGELEEEDFASTSRSESEFGTFEGSMDASRSNRAAYAQGVVDLLDRLTVNLGARRDHNDRFGRFDTYRAGAVLRPAPGSRIRGSFGIGFKEPTFFENFAKGFVRGNPELKPERTRSWEAGFDQELLEGRLWMAITYFDQAFRDLIEFTFAPPEEGAPNFFNVAAASADGAELEVVFRPLRSLAFRGAYTRLDTKVTDAGFSEDPDAAFAAGRRLLRRPGHTVAASLAYRHPTGGAVTVGFNMAGERDDLDFSDFPARRVALEPYATVDLSVSWPVLPAGRGPVEVTPTLRVENLFDSAHEEVTNFPARGRTAFLGAQVGLGG